MRDEYLKRGYKCAKGWRPRYFGTIHIDGDFHFNKEHNFVYDVVKAEDDLYMGLPCIFTDSRFDTDKGLNFYKSTYLFFALRSYPKAHNNTWTKIKRNPRFSARDLQKLPRTLKACIRFTRKVQGIPKGTKIDFGNHWYYPKSKNVPGYTYIHNGGNDFKVDFKVDLECYSARFTKDKRANEIVDKLRAAGFLVAVYHENPDRLYGEHEGELAFAYGFNKKIGISSFDDCFNGYGNGCKNVLYDYRGYFNKWSQALEIPKDTPVDEIVHKLVNEKVAEAYND